MYKQFGIKNEIIDFVNKCELELADDFKLIEKIYEQNQLKVLTAFREVKLSEAHFQESTGYGYNDIGRDKIEEIYSKIFHTEDALVRQQIVSGTHAISICLFALTRPNDKILSINGLPYDTIRPSLGLNNEKSSLKEYGVYFDFVDLMDDYEFDLEAIKNKLTDNVKLIMIQKSRGYSDRKAFANEQIKDVISYIKSLNDKVIIMVDNCYGEFVETLEPSDIGADIICGSLTKNPGGGLARSGGYICGKKELIEKCSYRLTAPGIGKEVGINYNQNRNVLMGLYMSPQIVYNAKKTVKLFAKVFNSLSIDTIPRYNEPINDIVISVKLDNKDSLMKFCEAVQDASPVDSFVKPIASPMPGYDHNVIMACGTFISGSSIELSCDAPEIEPYYVYLQGGLTYFQSKLTLMKILSNLNLI